MSTEYFRAYPEILGALPPPVSDFVYVDTAVGGVNRRNHVMQGAEFRPDPGAVDVFTTWTSFTEEFKTYADNNPSPTTGKPPSVAGYVGQHHAAYVPFDFDCAADPGKAIRDAVWMLQAAQVCLSIRYGPL